MPINNQLVYGYWVPFFWGLVVLASFLGWGSAIQRVASLPDTDWGLRCGWGMAFTAVLGGFLANWSLAARPVLIAMVASGAVLALLLNRFGGAGQKCAANPGLTPSFRRSLPETGCLSQGLPREMYCPFVVFPKRLSAHGLPSILKTRRAMLGWVGFLAVIVLVYAPRVIARGTNGCDDDVAYFVFAKRLLDSGTLIEPFSQRRLGAYGGHSLLQAVVWAFGSQKNLYLLDGGLSVVVLAGLVFGCCRKVKASIGLACLIAGLAILLPVPRISSMSQATGVTLFFALFRTLQLFTQRVPRWQAGVVTAMVVAATCSLRNTYIPVVAVFCAIGFLFADPLPFRRRLARLAGMGLATTLFLLPWMSLLHRSSGSWIYPLMPGNQQPGTALYSVAMTLGERVEWVGGFFLNTNVVPLVVPALLLAWAARDRLTAAFLFSALLATAALVKAFSIADYWDLFRYSHAALFAALLVALTSALGSREAANGNRSRRFALVAGAGFLLLLNALPAALGAFAVTSRMAMLPGQIGDDQPFYSAEAIASYRQLQLLVPPQATLFTVLSAPTLLDFNRPIFILDIPGACSPAPGMPFFRGPAALKSYLQAQGIEYVAYSDFEIPQCLYDRGRWRLLFGGTYVADPSALSCGVLQPRPPRRLDPMPLITDHPGALWKVQAPYFLDAMANVEALAQSEQLIYCENGLRLVHLKRAAPGESSASLRR